MSGTLGHSPADIVRRVLISLGQGVDPPGTAFNWPIFASGEPASPDNVITVYDTAGRDDGRVMIDGERQEHHGFQVRVRAKDHPTGWEKARAVAVAMDESLYDQTVTLGNTSYLVHSVSRTGGVLALGKESPESKRNLFTINAVVTITQL